MVFVTPQKKDKIVFWFHSWVKPKKWHTCLPCLQELRRSLMVAFPLCFVLDSPYISRPESPQGKKIITVFTQISRTKSCTNNDWEAANCHLLRLWIQEAKLLTTLAMVLTNMHDSLLMWLWQSIYFCLSK